jgi:hypothetical protein
MRAKLTAGVMLAMLPCPAWAAAPPPASAPQTSETKPVDPRAMDSARRLARLVNQEQPQVDATLRMVDTSFIPTLAANEDVKAMESEYPGILKKIAEDLKPIFVTYTRRILPDYIERYAAIYAADFSADEIDDLYKVYASPAGQRLIASMMNNASADSLLKEAVDAPESQSTLAAVKADHRRATAAALKQVSEEDKASFAEMMAKPYFYKMILVGPKLRKLEQDMINEPDASLDAEIERQLDKTIKGFIAAADKEE